MASRVEDILTDVHRQLPATHIIIMAILPKVRTLRPFNAFPRLPPHHTCIAACAHDPGSPAKPFTSCSATVARLSQPHWAEVHGSSISLAATESYEPCYQRITDSHRIYKREWATESEPELTPVLAVATALRLFFTNFSLGFREYKYRVWGLRKGPL